MPLTLAPNQAELAHKDLITPQLWQRLTTRITGDLQFQQAFGDEPEPAQRRLAERILNETLGFLTLCGDAHGESYSPSSLVDIGWHTFILYTREYAAFCEKVAGRFIHHSPSDVPGHDYGTGNVAHTMAALAARGPIDELLWASPSGGCDGTCDHGKCCTGCDPNKKK